jgi:zinc transport system substrate-binding protein
MKKYIVLLSAITAISMMVFLLAACGAGTSDSGENAGDGKSADSAETSDDGNAGSDNSGAEAEIPDGKLNVVATIFPEYDFARAISGGNADISMLIDPGASVHSYDPSPGDLKTIAAADVFIYVGGESDEWADRILESIDTDNMKIVRLMDHVENVEEELKEGMEPEKEEANAEEEKGAEEEAEEAEGPEYDEHVWVSPGNALVLMDAIESAMAEKDPAHKADYEKNAAAYKAELEKVDAEIADVVKTAKRRMIVVADKFPFRYFVDRYGLDYAAAFPGCSDQADAGAQTIAHLVSTVEGDKLPYIYHVELSNRNVADAIAEQTGAEPMLLNSCENISKDDFDSGVTYVNLMSVNVENLRKGLN